MNVLSNIPAAMTQCERIATEAIGKDLKAVSKTECKKVAKENNVPVEDVEAHARECYLILKAQQPSTSYVLEGIDQLKLGNENGLDADRPQFEFINKKIESAKAAAKEQKTQFQRDVMQALAPIAFMDSDAVAGFISILDGGIKHPESIQTQVMKNKGFIDNVKLSNWTTPENWRDINAENKRTLWAMRLSRKFCDMKAGRPLEFFKLVPNKSGTALISSETQPEEHAQLVAFWRSVFTQLAKHYPAK